MIFGTGAASRVIAAALSAGLFLCLASEAGAQQKRRRKRPPAKSERAKKAEEKSIELDFGGKKGFDLDINAAEAEKARKALQSVSLDFGGDFEGDVEGEFDFGEEEVIVEAGLSSEAKLEFDRALNLMSANRFEEAAVMLAPFADDPTYGAFQQEAQYQLAKALYKTGFIYPALLRFQAILNTGTEHRRFKKALEWLFFVARKMSDQSPVLAELARYRNLKFPKAYEDEYKFLLAKYLFVQAKRLEVARLAAEEFARSAKEAQSSSVDWEADGGGFDFGGGGGDAMDFGGGDAMDFGGGDSMDFGGGDGMDFGSDEMDFGGEAEAGPNLTTDTREAVRQGLELAEQIAPEGPTGARARYLKGLLHYLAGESQDAVNAFREVAALLNPRTAVRPDPDLREAAFLSLARVHYEYDQFGNSGYYYDQIGRDSEQWLTALYESSWAYYRRGDYEKALGNLITLNAPFFEEEYFPEATLIESIIYLESCRYKEARRVLDDFMGQFSSVLKEVNRLAELDPANGAVFTELRRLKTNLGKRDRIMKRVLGLVQQDDEIKDARAALQEIDDQITRFRKASAKFRDGTVGRFVLESLEAERANRAYLAGTVVQGRLEAEAVRLKTLLTQGYRVKIEVVRGERRMIQARMSGSSEFRMRAPVVNSVVDDEHIYWTYPGEYWRDELGTYEVDFAMCVPEDER